MCQAGSTVQINLAAMHGKLSLCKITDKIIHTPTNVLHIRSCILNETVYLINLSGI